MSKNLRLAIILGQSYGVGPQRDPDRGFRCRNSMCSVHTFQRFSTSRIRGLEPSISPPFFRTGPLDYLADAADLSGARAVRRGRPEQRVPQQLRCR